MGITMRFTAVLAILSLVLPAGALAEDPPPSLGRAFMHHYDKDNDNRISLEEYLEPSREQFRAMDSDVDGYLTAEESAAYVLTMQAKMLQNKSTSK
jgi:Ca2+-binding EF-hand superfamily protein